MNKATQDGQLIERYEKGDRAALDELFNRYRDAAYRVAYRLLGNEADALDAIQDSFIKALTHLSGFEQRSTFKTWLLRIVSNSSLDIGRKRARRLSLNEQVAGQCEQSFLRTLFLSDPSHEVEQADLRAALDSALLELPELQRRTFVLHVDAGLSYREVAQVMNISIGTVMSRLFYARQKLRDLLANRMVP